MFCRNCGVSISDESKFCPKCGTAVIHDEKCDITKTDDTIIVNSITSSEIGITDNIKGSTTVIPEGKKSVPNAKNQKTTTVKKKNLGRLFTKKPIILTCVTIAVGIIGMWIMPQYLNSMLFSFISQNSSNPPASVMAQLASDPDSEKVLRKKLALANSYSGAEEYGAAVALLEKLDYNRVDSAGDEIDTLLEENCKVLLADSQIRYASCQSIIISDNDKSHKCLNDVYLKAAQISYNKHDLNEFKTNIDKINTSYSYDEISYTELVYKCAVEEYNAGNYAEAAEIFIRVKSYSDASEYIKKCYYEQGKELQDQKKYTDAISYYKKAENYSDSKDRIKECNYLQGDVLYEKKQYEKALNYYIPVSGYKSSTDRIKYCKYYLGIDYYNKGDYSSAKKWLCQIKGFENTDTYLYNIDYYQKYSGWYINAYTCDDYYYKKTSFSKYDYLNIYINLFNLYDSKEKVKIRTVITDSDGTTATDYQTLGNNEYTIVSFGYQDTYWVSAYSATFKVYLDETNELLGSYTISLW